MQALINHGRGILHAAKPTNESTSLATLHKSLWTYTVKTKKRAANAALFSTFASIRKLEIDPITQQERVFVIRKRRVCLNRCGSTGKISIGGVITTSKHFGFHRLVTDDDKTS